MKECILPGTAGDSMALQNGMKFSTYNRNTIGCAKRWKGAWWYKNCHNSNLNGLYLGARARSATGMNWYRWKWDRRSMKKTEMKIRPTGF